MKIIRIFLSENCPFLVVKFSIYLNKRVKMAVYDLVLHCLPTSLCVDARHK